MRWLPGFECKRMVLCTPLLRSLPLLAPYAGRYAKLRQYQAQVLVRDGTWRNKLLSGPQSFADWEASWRVYATALVMLGVAYPGDLQKLLRRNKAARRAVSVGVAVHRPPR